MASAWLRKPSRSLRVEVPVTVKELAAWSREPRVPVSVRTSPGLSMAVGGTAVVTRLVRRSAPVGAVPATVLNAWLLRMVAPLATAPPALRLPSRVTLFVAAASVSWPRGMVRFWRPPEITFPLASTPKPWTKAPLAVTSWLEPLRVKVPSRVNCWPAVDFKTKKPSPLIAMLVSTPVVESWPGWKSVVMAATCEPMPSWLGLLPPKSPLGPLLDLSVP